MSAYPPPPPDSPFARDAQRAQYRAQQAAYRAQRQAYRAQQRMQQAVYRNQRRALRRGSILGPLLLLSVGVFFLLAGFHRVSGLYALEWFGRWWPAVLIAAGVVLLLEWALDQSSDRNAVAPRTIGGGVVTLLVLLAFAGLAAHVAARGMAWKNENGGRGFGKLDEVLGNRNDRYDVASSAIAPGGLLVIRNPHGDVTVTGTSTDGQVHVDIHKQAVGWNTDESNARLEKLQPVFSSEGKDLVLTVSTVRGGQDDLTVTVPAGNAVTVNADHGDVELSGLKNAVTVSANRGDVTLNDIDGNVQSTVNDDDATVTMHHVHGSLSLQGHTGDIDITEVTGTVSLQGEFFGTTHVEHVSGPLRFQSSRTSFSAARLDDEFSIQHDSLDASQLLGPVLLKTTNKNITLDHVLGDVEISDSNGSVAVTNTSPLGKVDIQNRHGSVDLGLPPSAAFTLDAQTRNGDMENDFGFSTQENGDAHTLRGNVGGGGAKISIVTSDGDVTVRKSSAIPVQPPSPAPPKAPKSVHPPQSPKAPSSYSF